MIEEKKGKRQFEAEEKEKRKLERRRIRKLGDRKKEEKCETRKSWKKGEYT